MLSLCPIDDIFTTLDSNNSLSSAPDGDTLFSKVVYFTNIVEKIFQKERLSMTFSRNMRDRKRIVSQYRLVQQALCKYAPIVHIINNPRDKYVSLHLSVSTKFSCQIITLFFFLSPLSLLLPFHLLLKISPGTEASISCLCVLSLTPWTVVPARATFVQSIFSFLPPFLFLSSMLLGRTFQFQFLFVANAYCNWWAKLSVLFRSQEVGLLAASDCFILGYFFKKYCTVFSPTLSRFLWVYIFIHLMSLTKVILIMQKSNAPSTSVNYRVHMPCSAQISKSKKEEGFKFISLIFMLQECNASDNKHTLTFTFGAVWTPSKINSLEVIDFL